MAIFLHEMGKMPDDQLISISNGQIPLGMLNARSTTTAEEVINKAKSILYTRQKKKLWHETSWGKIIIGIIIGVTIMIIGLVINIRWKIK